MPSLASVNTRAIERHTQADVCCVRPHTPLPSLNPCHGLPSVLLASSCDEVCEERRHSFESLFLLGTRDSALNQEEARVRGRKGGKATQLVMRLILLRMIEVKD